MPTSHEWRSLSERLSATLHLTTTPIGIAFSSSAPRGVPAFDGPLAEPSADGRTGRVPAGCVFWNHAAERSFTTTADDHGNCSVGSVTHGLRTAAEVVGNSDLDALVSSGWAPDTLLDVLPRVSSSPTHVTYGPLGSVDLDPDVVLVKLNAKQLMVLRDAEPSMRIEGKPQCHIIPLAMESQEVAASVGCMLSRVRTAMSSTEMACVIPGPRLNDVIERLEETNRIDAAVAGYAAEDGLRFVHR